MYFTPGPGGVQEPTVNVLNATAMEVSWQPPISPNGRLESYVVKLPLPRLEVANVSTTRLVITNLIPYTEYYVTITACSGQWLQSEIYGGI